jgi:hypothetical protein
LSRKWTIEEKNMKIVIRDVEYKVRFRHDPPDLFERETVCDFFDGEKLRYTGWAICVEGDQFQRAKGRQIALTRAIANLPREDRKLVWKQYFAAIRGGTA